MSMYLISFPGAGAAMKFPADELAHVAEAARAVVDEARDAGVLVFADGTTHDNRTYPETENLNGGFTILDLPTRDEAHRWAAKIAEACRCSQEVRVFQGGWNP